MRRKVKQKKMRCGKIVPGLTILFILLTGFPAGFQMEYVYAAEPAYETGISEDAQTETEKWIQQFSFDEMQNYIDQMFPEKNYNLEEMLRKITEGDYEEFLSQAGKMLRDKLFQAVESGRKYLIPIVFLAFLAALFHNFSQVFESGQLSETSFYVLYLLLIALCLKVFLAVTEWVSTGVEGLTAFMGVFCPLYFLAVAIAKGSVTAIAFYQLVLFIIYLVELLIAKILLPMIHIYMILRLLNYLSKEDYLSKFAGFLEMLVSWTLRTMLAAVVGWNLVQGLIGPSVDDVKQSLVTRGMEAIPGVGDLLGGAAEVTIGTLVLVKNGIGVVGALFAVLLCLVPLVEVGLVVLLYKFTAALLQPVSDVRVIGCIESVGDGLRLFMRVLFTTGLLFLLTIVVVAATTGE